MTTCYIIRHAAKERGDFFNSQLRHQDEPISATGQAEAQKLCRYFDGTAIAAIYVSEYQRTRQTIEPVAQQLQLTPVIDERLNEIDNGRLDGMTDEQIQQTYPEVWQAFLSRSADFRFPEGETGAEAQRRVVEFLEEKRDDAEADDLREKEPGVETKGLAGAHSAVNEAVHDAAFCGEERDKSHKLVN